MRKQTDTRQELEAATRRLLAGTAAVGSDASKSAKTAGPAVGILAALVAFLWGRRRARRKAVVVKVHRSK